MKNFILSNLFLALFLLGFTEKREVTCNIKFVPDIKVPIVRGTINNKESYFLLDSGASISILDANQSNHYGYTIIPPKDFKENYITGFGSREQVTRAGNVRMKLGGSIVQTPYWVVDLEAIRDAIEKGSHYQITGIIGSDLLSKYDYILDYERKSLCKQEIKLAD